MANGWGCQVGTVVVAFDDMSSDAWGRVNAHCNNLVDFVMPDGTERRKTWLDAYASPMDDPIAARIIHEEAVKVAEPKADPPSRSRQLAFQPYLLRPLLRRSLAANRPLSLGRARTPRHARPRVGGPGARALAAACQSHRPQAQRIRCPAPGLEVRPIQPRQSQ